MNYNQLPVFKAAYDLLLEFFNSTQHMKREYRYSLGEELKKEMMNLLIAVYRASLSEDKQGHILQAREHMEVVKLHIRLLFDLKQIPLKKMAQITLKNDSVSKQLAAWHKAVIKKEAAASFGR
ncbi:MAG: four helix bundle protein [Bacteroidales bacterium]